MVSETDLRAVLFDMDGVLVDSFEVWYHAMNATARELGHGHIRHAQLAASWGQGVQEDISAYYPGSSLLAVEQSYARTFTQHLEHLVAMPGAAEVLGELQCRGVQVGVVTNTPAELAHRMLRIVGLHPDTLVGGSDVPAPKPAPDMVYAAAARLGIEPPHCLVVGDSRFDRTAARAAGAPFAGYGGIEGDCTLTALTEVLPLFPGCEGGERVR